MENNVVSLSEIEQLRKDFEIEHRFKTAVSGYEKKDVNNYLESLQENFSEVRNEIENECARLRGENAGLAEKLQELQKKLSEADAREAAPEANRGPSLEEMRKELVEQTWLEALEQARSEVTDEVRAELREELRRERAADAGTDTRRSLMEQERAEAMEQIRREAWDTALREAREKAAATLQTEPTSEAEQKLREGVVANLRAANDRLMKENRRKQMEITGLQEQLNDLRDSLAGGSQELISMNERLGDLLGSKVEECLSLLNIWREEADGIVKAIGGSETEQV